MDKAALIAALGSRIPVTLATELVEEFLALRQDMMTGRLGGSSPGKFVESFVQVLQFLEAGKYDANPAVDKYLRELDSRVSILADDLRICASRIARSIYSLRNKRSISHKGEVDPNTFDLRFLHACAQWILAELIRTVTTVKMEEAGHLIEQVMVPVGGMVEDFDGQRLVLAELSARDEVLVLLHSHYPEYVGIADLIASADRRDASTVRKATKTLWRERLVAGDLVKGFRLTERGLKDATSLLSGA